MLPPWTSSQEPGLPQLPGCQPKDKAHAWGRQGWAILEKRGQALTEPRKPPPSLWIPHPSRASGIGSSVTCLAWHTGVKGESWIASPEGRCKLELMTA